MASNSLNSFDSNSNPNQKLRFGVVTNKFGACLTLFPNLARNPTTTIITTTTTPTTTTIGGEPSGVGQLGLSQRVTELRTTTVKPNGVRVQGHTDESLPVPVTTHHPSFPGGHEIGVTGKNVVVSREVMRAHLLSASPARERFSTPIDAATTILSPNPVTTQNHTFHHNNALFGKSKVHYSQNPICSSSPSYRLHQTPAGITIIDLDHEPPRAKPQQGTPRPLCPIPLNVYFPNQTGNYNNPSGGNSSFRNLYFTERNKNHLAFDYPMVIDLDDDDDDENDNKKMKNDGRIHSLPYKKHGPYTCPRCRKVFPTSQHFASHVSASHYKNETEAQRKRRLMDKIGRKSDLRVQRSRFGVTLVPISSSNATDSSSGNNNRFTGGRFGGDEGSETSPGAAGPLVKAEGGEDDDDGPPPGFARTQGARERPAAADADAEAAPAVVKVEVDEGSTPLGFALKGRKRPATAAINVDEEGDGDLQGQVDVDPSIFAQGGKRNRPTTTVVVKVELDGDEELQGNVDQVDPPTGSVDQDGEKSSPAVVEIEVEDGDSQGEFRFATSDDNGIDDIKVKEEPTT